MNQQDIDELTEVFVEEAQEIIENLNKDVLELEKHVGDSTLNRDLINNIFRYVHTLKGNSGLAGADKLRDLAHKMESLLDKLRKEKLQLSASIVDVLFAGIDRFSPILQEVISGSDQRVSIEDLTQQLEAIMSGKSANEPETKQSAPTNQISERSVATASPIPSEDLPASIPADIIRVLTTYEETRLANHLARNSKIYEAILNLSMEQFEQTVTAVIQQIHTAGEVIAKIPSSKTLPGYDLQVRLIFASSSSIQHLTQLLQTFPVLTQQNFSLHLLLDGHTTTPTQKPSLPPVPNQVVHQQKPEFKDSVTPLTRDTKTSVPPEKKEKTELAGKAIPPKESIDQSGNTVRVDIKKLDNLMNIVGELVLAKARYLQLESEIEGSSAYKALLENLKKNNKSTSKKLEDLREAILQVRMVQIGSLFNRFPRIVRDLARSHHKQIQLVLEGEETELDKAVVDEMGDPLIHLIRNAVDHGIEDQETRQKAGKPEIGTITLRAYQQGSYIVIEIQDDGAGMDIKRIREKAIEAGLVEPGSKLSRNEILNLIFHPGFSTAKTITDTSGRGVGMDVVKLTISKLKGIIDIQTVVGTGTTFIVKLPLTLAIIQVLLIRISNHTYAIPLSTVTESFKLQPQKIETVDGQEVTQLRHIVLPLLRLKEAFGLTESKDRPGTSQNRGFVVVIGLAEKKIGLIVDELLEQQEIVIKPLGQYLIHIPGFAGATTLGDGRVVLILDIIGLIENFNTRTIALQKQQLTTKKKGLRKRQKKTVASTYSNPK